MIIERILVSLIEVLLTYNFIKILGNHIKITTLLYKNFFNLNLLHTLNQLHLFWFDKNNIDFS